MPGRCRTRSLVLLVLLCAGCTSVSEPPPEYPPLEAPLHDPTQAPAAAAAQPPDAGVAAAPDGSAAPAAPAAP